MFEASRGEIYSKDYRLEKGFGAPGGIEPLEKLQLCVQFGSLKSENIERKREDLSKLNSGPK